jgi:endonuclease/exonuclease/phosphatase family metal-dependent hydrolase
MKNTSKNSLMNSCMCLSCDKPCLIGDFNLVRSQKDKSNENVNWKWCDRFNEWVDKHSLIEICLQGRAFTWTKNQENAVMANLDRVFCSTDFDSRFPLGSARALPRAISDHIPILWEFGKEVKLKGGRFKVEK